MQIEEVAKILEVALETGRAAKTGEKYMLTAPAQMALRAEYSRVYANERENEKLIKAYEAFEFVNTELKQLITDWQTIEIGGEKISNDHSNSDYDDKIIDRLAGLHERYEPIHNRMTAELPRLKAYKDSLLQALEKAEDGEIEWVSDAKIPSYHTVWFEMHEDLLRVLGREREE